MTASPFPLCFNNNTSANVQEQNSFPLHLTKASQELERDFAVCNTSKKWGPVRLPRGSISSSAETGTSNEQEGSMDGAGGAVRLREDGQTDRERLAEQLWSSAAAAERSGDDLSRAEPGQISLKTPRGDASDTGSCGIPAHPSLCNTAEELPLTPEPLKSRRAAEPFPRNEGSGKVSCAWPMCPWLSGAATPPARPWCQGAGSQHTSTPSTRPKHTETALLGGQSSTHGSSGHRFISADVTFPSLHSIQTHFSQPLSSASCISSISSL